MNTFNKIINQEKSEYATSEGNTCYSSSNSNWREVILKNPDMAQFLSGLIGKSHLFPLCVYSTFGSIGTFLG